MRVPPFSRITLLIERLQASAAAKDIGVFAAKIQKEANQINNTIKKQRDLATKKWGNYKVRRGVRGREEGRMRKWEWSRG
eukprot:588856-Amorphochlora_amoeboformis.AAC.1